MKQKKTAQKPEITKKPRYFVGVDTGVKTGFAVWDRLNACFLSIETMQIHRALEKALVLNEQYKGDIIFYVEDARKRKHDKGLTPEKAQGAGSVKRDAKIWEDFLTDKGIPFQMKAPNGRLNTIAGKEDVWIKNTGWDKKVSEHARCASMLVWKI